MVSAHAVHGAGQICSPCPHFFETPFEFRTWLARHATSESELLVGFYKRGTGLPSLTWPESVDEARFRRNKSAWKFFEAQPPGYRHQAIWRIVSAKRVETREARLVQLTEASSNVQRL